MKQINAKSKKQIHIKNFPLELEALMSLKGNGTGVPKYKNCHTCNMFELQINLKHTP